jgi:hypothetical protein
MDGNWWVEIDEAVLGCLAEGGSMTPAEIAGRLALSEETVVSLVGMLAREGRARICLVAPMPAVAVRGVAPAIAA